MSRMLQAIRSSLDARKYSALLEAVSRGTYFYQDDLNKDKYIEFGEFLKAITSVKNRDPKDFAVFLKAAKTIKPLKSGSVCRPNGAGDACPKGNTCQLTQKASGRPVYIDRPRVGGRRLQGIIIVKQSVLVLVSMPCCLCCPPYCHRLLFYPCEVTPTNRSPLYVCLIEQLSPEQLSPEQLSPLSARLATMPPSTSAKKVRARCGW